MKILDIIPRSTIWTDYIKVLTQDGKRRQAQDQDLETVLNEAVEVEYMHEGRVGSLGKSSQYNRKLANSLFFNENYYVNLFSFWYLQKYMAPNLFRI